MQKLIAQGAEAKLFEENNEIIKLRFNKTYRIKELDEKLRGFRTRREAKILQKLQKINFHSPKLIKSDDKEIIVIERMDGNLLKDVLKKDVQTRFCREIGYKVAALHNNGIVHGDLTTSNMIYAKNSEGIFCIYFIDFGLSFFSDKAEDKAVDLHLLKEALESKHHEIWEECFKIILEFYKKEAKLSGEILKRLEAVEKRGRYHAKKFIGKNAKRNK